MAHFTIDFYSNALKRPVQFQMIIPNDVNEDWQPIQKRKGKTMKTLFLLHGYTGWGHNWVPEHFAKLYNMAIVIPNGENGFWLDGLSTGHKFGSFVGEELIAYIRKTFGLCMNAEDTYIMGCSMGGFGALHTALAYPETFRKVIALSPAIIIHQIAHMKPGFADAQANYEYYRECFGDLETVEESRNNPEVLVDEILAKKGRMPEIYMAIGTDDFLLANTREFHAFLESRKVPHVYVEDQGTHEDAFWEEHGKRFLEQVLEED